jgi:glycosyltransferase involved in cell wall biosynthesis
MKLRVISCLTSGRVSGVDVFATHLTRGLRARGFDASILLTEWDEKVPDPMPLADDVPVHSLDVKPGDSGRRRRQALFSYLEDMAPCIYIPNYDYRHSIVSARVSDRIAAVGIVHSDDPMHYDHVHRLGKYWNAVVAVSDVVAQKTAALEPSVAPRLATIPYGVAAPAVVRPRNRTAADPLRLLYAGRLEHAQKRILDFPKILDALVDRGVPVRLTIVGSGAGYSELAAAGRRHLASGALTLRHTVPNHLMSEYFNEADAFVLCSGFEGLPLGLLEAMAHGAAAVVTDVESGIPELIRHGENGFRVPVGDVAAFADRLTQLQQDPALQARLAEQGRQTVIDKGLTVDRMCDVYAQLFERVHTEALQGGFQRPRAFFGEPTVRRVYLQADRKLRRWAGRARGAALGAAARWGLVRGLGDSPANQPASVGRQGTM